MDADIKKYLDRLYNKITSLEQRLVKQEKSTWLTANQLNKQLGIGHRKLEKYRALGQVEFKKSRGGGWLYRLESVPQEFIKQAG